MNNTITYEDGTVVLLDEDDVPELTEEDFARMRPIAEIDPALLLAHQNGTIKRRGRPTLANKKHNISLRLDPDVIKAWRASGANWQSRINELLRTHAPD